MHDQATLCPALIRSPVYSDESNHIRSNLQRLSWHSIDASGLSRMVTVLSHKF